MKYKRTPLPDAGEIIEITDGKDQHLLRLQTAFLPEQVTHPGYRRAAAAWTRYARFAIRSYRLTNDHIVRQAANERKGAPISNVIDLSGRPKKRWQR